MGLEAIWDMRLIVAGVNGALRMRVRVLTGGEVISSVPPPVGLASGAAENRPPLHFVGISSEIGRSSSQLAVTV